MNSRKKRKAIRRDLRKLSGELIDKLYDYLEFIKSELPQPEDPLHGEFILASDEAEPGEEEAFTEPPTNRNHRP